MSELRFDGRVAIITGAGAPDGIGAAVARQFVDEGARVVLGVMAAILSLWGLGLLIAALFIGVYRATDWWIACGLVIVLLIAMTRWPWLRVAESARLDERPPALAAEATA